MPKSPERSDSEHPAVSAARELVVELRSAIDDPEGIKATLLELAQGDDGARVKEFLEGQLKLELLEVQWEIEDVIEAATPKTEPPPEPVEEEPEPEEAEDPNRPLTAADLDLVYDDPRGLMLHKAKKGERWFATQVDPRTGQPQTFELHPQEISQLKMQLDGSPYWLIGGGL